ncbi:MAG: SDR family NAD(P)-dependent oxidoreductase [Halorientalis sp.]
MPTDQFSVAGRNAIVTGASRGIGEATAKRLAADGANVAICSRTQADVDAVAEAIEAEGGTALAVECNIRDADAVDRLVEETVSTFGGVDLVVNNAGGEFTAPFEEISENGWQAVVDLNLNGTVRVIQAAGEYMRENGGGDIINVSSVNGQRAAPTESHYGASKAALINLTETVAAEWAEHEIRVNCVAPGLVQTEGVAAVLGVDESNLPEREEVDRRIARPIEIADVVQFLASTGSSFMNGETVTAKGVPPTEQTSDFV